MKATTKQFCPDCGTELSQPEGICPKCLFSRAKADTTVTAGDVPTTLDSTLEPVSGSVAPKVSIKYFGDYELLEEIARGGMGVVNYKVIDDKPDGGGGGSMGGPGMAIPNFWKHLFTVEMLSPDIPGGPKEL